MTINAKQIEKDIEEILETVKVFINRDLDDKYTLFPKSVADTWTDAASYSILRNTTKSRVFENNLIDRNSHIYRRLGHITVNPNDEMNTQALKEVYVYESDSEEEDTSHIVVANRNPITSRAFLQELMKNSINQRRYFTGEINADEGMTLPSYCLYGKRGCGKTFYLNHFFSLYHSDLDENNIVWIRVNLVERFPKPNGNHDQWLITWIYSQIAKIIIRYYDPKSDYYNANRQKPIELDLYKSIYAHIMERHEQDNKHRTKQQDLIAYLYNTLQRKGVEAEVDPPNFPLYIGKFIIDEAIKKGYAFIVVLDGLDRLEAVPSEQEKYEKLYGQAEALSCSSSRRGYTLVTVTRTQNPDENPQDVFGPRTEKEYKVFSVPLQNIIDKRITYVKKEINEITRKHNNPAKWPHEGGDQHLDEFIIYLNSRFTEDMSTEQSYCETLTDIFSVNKRAQLQTIQLAYLKFLEQAQERHYRLIEMLCLGGCVYPPRPFEYRYFQKSRNVQRKIGTQGKKFDHHLLPSVFLFPYVQHENRLTYDHIPSIDAILMGVRIMQIIYSYEEARKCTDKHMHIHSVGTLLSGDVSGILGLLFEYKEEAVIQMIEEFAEYELISVTGDDGASIADEKTRYSIYMMPKLRYIMKNIHDIAYLNMAAMRVPLKTETLADKTPYFIAKSYVTQGRNIAILEWIGAKITNSIALYRIIRTVNRQQKRMYERNHTKSDERQKIVIQFVNESIGGFFDCLDDISQNIIGTIANAVLPSVPKPEQNIPELLKLIKAFVKRWELV